MFAAGLLLLLFAVVGRGFRRLIRSDLLLILGVAFFSVFIAYACDLWSLQYLSSSESALLFNLSPFAAALFSYWWFGERMTLKKWLGMVVAVTSIIPIVTGGESVLTHFPLWKLLPIFALLTSVLSSAYGWILVRELVKTREFSPFFINGIAMTIGGSLALGLSWVMEGWNPLPVFSWPNFIFFTILMIFIANILFVNLYSVLLRRYTATFISFSGLMCPLFVALLGRIFLNEELTGSSFISALLVASGLFLFYEEELRQGYITKKTDVSV
ncbi:MAG: hypothetical protein UW09_C0003G0083 [candidate division TM6 bacterium GW2011_GWF2_43_87]|nr:MAG: hypothetical protein UW09_C0003G0083 [candidate division TM6 bacterium GW2011_GWF2_43_87]